MLCTGLASSNSLNRFQPNPKPISPNSEFRLLYSNMDTFTAYQRTSNHFYVYTVKLHGGFRSFEFNVKILPMSVRLSYPNYVKEDEDDESLASIHSFFTNLCFPNDAILAHRKSSIANDELCFIIPRQYVNVDDIPFHILESYNSISLFQFWLIFFL